MHLTVALVEHRMNTARHPFEPREIRRESCCCELGDVCGKKRRARQGREELSCLVDRRHQSDGEHCNQKHEYAGRWHERE